MNAMTNIFTRKTKIILFAAVVVYMAALAATDTYHQYTYARNLSIRGVVVAIQWKTHNHALPKLVIMEKTGKRIALSQYTIALTPSDIKVGDKIVKEKGSAFCTVNGRRVRFSLH